MSWDIVTDTVNFLDLRQWETIHQKRSFIDGQQPVWLTWFSGSINHTRQTFTLSKQPEDWDSALPHEMEKEWITWKTSLRDLQELWIQRPYLSFPLCNAQDKELFVFSNAPVQVSFR